MRQHYLISYSYLPKETWIGTINRTVLAYVEEDELETIREVAAARHISLDKIEKLESTLWTEVIGEFTKIGG